MSIGIIAALPGELKPLVAGWKQVKAGVWSGTIGEQRCVAAADGMGQKAARRACEKVFAAAGDADPIDTLFSVGWAGALSCGVKPPDAWAVSEVIDARTGERFFTQPEDARAA